MAAQNRVKALAVVATVILSGRAHAGPPGDPLGILTPETLAGNNPATGVPWAVGDTYRFAFIASKKTTAESADISTYNTFVQDLANATTVYDIGEDEGVAWKIIGSTSEVDAIDNTSTTWTDEDLGCPIYLLDGSTLIAGDYRDLWDGNIQHIINLTETGEDPAQLGDVFLLWPWTGTYWDGTASEDHGSSGGALGSMGGSTPGQVGQGNASSTTDWIWRIWTMDPMTNLITVYALSDPLVIVDLLCPSTVRASSGAAGVTLAWRNGNEMPISVRILRDTVEIASAAPVDPPAYSDTGAPPGLLEYELIFTMPSETCDSLTTTYNACITDLAATPSEDGVVLTWTNNLTYVGIEIRRDGEVLEASLGGAVETYTDATPAIDGIVTYSVVPVNGTCDAAAVEVDMTLVRNAGFEDPPLADGDWITGGTHWDTGSYDAADRTVWIPGWDDAGVWNPDAADGFSGSAAFAGQNTGWVISWAQYDGGLSQVLLARVEADTEYVLSAQVGNAFYNESDATAPYRLELWAGDVLLASETGAAPAADTWELKSLTYASGPDPVGLGLPLEIRLVAAAYVDGSGIDGYEVDFDDVRLAITGVPEERFRFKRGDANADGKRDIADAIKVLGYLFGGGTTQLGCLDAGDANDDGKIDIADAIKILGHLFASAGDLPEPFGTCGKDLTEDTLECASFPPCDL